MDALYCRRLDIHAKPGARQWVLGADSVNEVFGFVHARTADLQAVGGFDHARLGGYRVFDVAHVHLAELVTADEAFASRSLEVDRGLFTHHRNRLQLVDVA